tara:strand:- start:3551 stop:3928 length:378 start_codon:yes stop_codon:yes gene_type:complete
MIYNILLFIFSLNLNNIKLPPIGAIYTRNINLPLIGDQYIETEYINKNTARIQLNGLINENGTSKIYVENDKEIVKISDNLLNVMNKYKCNIDTPRYDDKKDTVIFKLNIRYLFSKEICLIRFHK